MDKVQPTSSEPATREMVDLIIAARVVAYEDQSPEALRELDRALEKFADKVKWENEP